jgi:hypothetical protein
MIDRKLLALRISLVLAVGAAIAVVGLAQFELRPRMQALSQQRDEFRISSEQNRARAMKAETYARQLSERLVEAESRAETALRGSKRAADENARVLLDLEETRAGLHSTKQELARWNAAGISPDQVASLAGENKALAKRLSKLQADYDRVSRVSRDLTNAQRILDITFDPEVPDLPPMRGSILVVDPKWNFVVLDIGEAKGLVKNGILMVSREGKLIGKVKVRRVESDRSIADILPGWRLAELREGDQVIN